jgi:CRISPR/Cas system-associated protein Cas10 (large subunit of type III CRISPR-Cas system)
MSDLGNDSTRIKKVVVQSYNLKELARIYNVSKYIMRKLMKPYKLRIGNPNGYDYDVDQVALIFELIHLPSNIRIVKV